MQFIDLDVQQNRIREKLELGIRKVLDHGQYIMGPEVKELEDRLGCFVGVKHAIACGSGTDSLLLALMAYNVGPGDAIFTTPFTFFATAEVIRLLGATPIFVDVDPYTFNIDPSQLEKAISALKNGNNTDHVFPRTYNLSRLIPKGVIAVDLFGLPADFDHIDIIARDHGLFVIEDSAQSLGAEYKGRKACSLSEVGCTSFFPAKPLGCYGDGGMCFTDNDNVAETIRSLRIHGKGEHKYDNVRIGLNSRLDTLQAAILLAKFEAFPEEIELRQEVARRYSETLNHHPSLLTPRIPEECRSSWAQYSVLAENEKHRAALRAKLKDAGIPAAVYYPKPLHLQPALRSLGYQKGDFPESEDRAQRIFSIPMHPYLSKEEQERVVGALAQV